MAKSLHQTSYFLFSATRYGVGKSTLLANLAVFLHCQGKKVAIIDFQSQFSEKLKSLFSRNLSLEIYSDLSEIRSSASNRYKKTFFVTNTDRLSFFPAFNLDTPFEVFQDASLRDFLRQIQAEFEYIFFNLSHGIRSFDFMVKCLQERRPDRPVFIGGVIVTTPEIRTVAEIDLLFRQIPALQHYSSESILVAFNKVSKEIENQNIEEIQLGLSDIKSVLKLPNTVKIPFLDELKSPIVNLAALSDIASPVRQAIASLARHISGFTSGFISLDEDDNESSFQSCIDKKDLERFTPLLFQVKHAVARRLFVSPDKLTAFLERHESLVRIRIRLSSRTLRDFPLLLNLDHTVDRSDIKYRVFLNFPYRDRIEKPSFVEFKPKREKYNISIDPIYNFDDRFASRTSFNITFVWKYFFSKTLPAETKEFSFCTAIESVPNLAQILGYSRSFNQMPLKEMPPDLCGLTLFLSPFPSEFPLVYKHSCKFVEDLIASYYVDSKWNLNIEFFNEKNYRLLERSIKEKSLIISKLTKPNLNLTWQINPNFPVLTFTLANQKNLNLPTFGISDVFCKNYSFKDIEKKAKNPEIKVKVVDKFFLKFPNLVIVEESRQLQEKFFVTDRNIKSELKFSHINSANFKYYISEIQKKILLMRPDFRARHFARINLTLPWGGITEYKLSTSILSNFVFLSVLHHRFLLSFNKFNKTSEFKLFYSKPFISHSFAVNVEKISDFFMPLSTIFKFCEMEVSRYFPTWEKYLPPADEPIKKVITLDHVSKFILSVTSRLLDIRAESSKTPISLTRKPDFYAEPKIIEPQYFFLNEQQEFLEINKLNLPLSENFQRVWRFSRKRDFYILKRFLEHFEPRLLPFQKISDLKIKSFHLINNRLKPQFTLCLSNSMRKIMQKQYLPNLKCFFVSHFDLKIKEHKLLQNMAFDYRENWTLQCLPSDRKIKQLWLKPPVNSTMPLSCTNYLMSKCYYLASSVFSSFFGYSPTEAWIHEKTSYFSLLVEDSITICDTINEKVLSSLGNLRTEISFRKKTLLFKPQPSLFMDKFPIHMQSSYISELKLQREKMNIERVVDYKILIKYGKIQLNSGYTIQSPFFPFFYRIESSLMLIARAFAFKQLSLSRGKLPIKGYSVLEILFRDLKTRGRQYFLASQKYSESQIVLRSPLLKKTQTSLFAFKESFSSCMYREKSVGYKIQPQVLRRCSMSIKNRQIRDLLSVSERLKNLALLSTKKINNE